jgi:organic hydroperoxide reductase OsmC/OhrA
MTGTHTYHAEVNWHRGVGEMFTDNRYSRRHLLRIDGGVEVPGSSSPLSVPLPCSDPAAVDPEEAFVVSSYRDPASGVMTKNAAGKLWVSCVTLRPQTEFDGRRRPSREALLALHHRAHEECFIANSVRTEVRCEPS